MTDLANAPQGELSFQNSVTEALPGLTSELKAFSDKAAQTIADAGLSEHGIGIVYMGGSLPEGSLTLTDRNAGPGMAEFKQVSLIPDATGNISSIRLQSTRENESGTAFSRTILEDSTYTIADRDGVLHLDVVATDKPWTQSLDKKPEPVIRTDDPTDLERLQTVLQGGETLLAADIKTRQEMQVAGRKAQQDTVMPEAVAVSKSRVAGILGRLHLSRNK